MKDPNVPIPRRELLDLLDNGRKEVDRGLDTGSARTASLKGLTSALSVSLHGRLAEILSAAPESIVNGQELSAVCEKVGTAVMETVTELKLRQSETPGRRGEHIKRAKTSHGAAAKLFRDALRRARGKIAAKYFDGLDWEDLVPAATPAPVEGPEARGRAVFP